ncbi:hypothetical protein [Haladaptatus caseinilyticus]|uniref:hypothetical protein n=1 Tax=Haladaptatus caseinilyticus TaxID=2993314 RepID=UPI00224ADC1E|nr:hypothetical protein [Haladaptatus caseinilyticus]
MQLLEPLMHWPPFHLHRICNPPSSHCWKFGLTNHAKKIAISRLLRKSSLLIAFTLVLGQSAY